MGYRAFFSYARADDRTADWLHRQLDSYRTPKALIATEGELGPVPPKLHPIFRDRTDLEAGGHVDAALQQALEDSETLVVLCTPTSAKSRWVNHECETFLRLGREPRVFPVIGAGEPDSSDPDTECFPPALRGKGLLAADLREIKLPNGQLVGDGREGGRLKLIAGLLGVHLDALAQRERRRQRQLVAALGAAALTFAAVAAFAATQTYFANQNQQRAIRSESEAVRQREMAETSAREARVTAARASFFEGLYWLRAGDNHLGEVRMEMWIESLRAFDHGLELLGEDDGNVEGVNLRELLAYGRRFVLRCTRLDYGDRERASQAVRTFFIERAGMAGCGGAGLLMRRETPGADSE